MSRKPVHVGSKRQLFIDEELIEQAQNVRLVVNKPFKTGEKCIVAEYPWEGHRIGGYNSVMEDNGIYKMWYDSIDNDGQRWLCYATSKDGVRWEKPMLKVVAHKNIEKTNIVFPTKPRPFEPGCVFKDTRPSTAEDEKYKMACSYTPEEGEPGVYAFSSPDGVHWKQLSDKPSFRPSDTGNVCFWDGRTGSYVAYVRVWAPMRKVGRCEFNDITNWGKEKTTFSYDELDPPDMDFYNSAAVKYPYADDVYLMFPSAYHHYPEPPKGKHRNDGPLDIRFAVSRDGIAWKRPDRGPFIPLGVKGQWDDSALYMTTGMIRNDNQLFMYYSGYDFTHGAYEIKRDKFKGVISRVTIRSDGFASLDSDYTGGRVVTKPLTFKGDRLNLNVDTGVAGEARVELLDSHGKPITGYSLTESDPVRGNFVEKTVTWNGDSDISRFAGKPVKLHFFLRDAKLYAFQFR
ncbi:MAG: hypothetical protein ACETWE_03535 [Candidatus Bathyarchaeia archaeon]